MSRNIRKQTLSLQSYLEKVNEDDIRKDQDVQRLAGQFSNAMINELIYTVLTDDYIPPIILGEENIWEDIVQTYIIDGLQRTESLIRFRYCNYRISSSMDNSIVYYQKKRTDKNGKIERDSDGVVLWDAEECNLVGKTYDKLPKELQKKFNDYQIETVTQLDCTMIKMSKFVRRYNNHPAMKPGQKTFTYLDNFARKIRNVVDGRFFKDCGVYTPKERKNGTLEMIVVEAVMAANYLDEWKKGISLGKFINDNASESDFESIDRHLNLLSKVVDKQLPSFNSKNSFVFVALLEKFSKYGVGYDKFVSFLDALDGDLADKKVDEISFKEIDKWTATKDKKTVVGKLHILEELMIDFLQLGEIPESNREDDSVINFVRENVFDGVTDEDVTLYEDMLSDIALNVDNNTDLLEQSNHNSLIGIVAYSCVLDANIDEWIIEYFSNNSTYIRDQKQNYELMRRDFDSYVNKYKTA